MPVSWPGQIGTVVDAVVRRSPRSVIDIGCGWGVYGAVIRAALPDVDMVGVEPWPAYRWDHRGGAPRRDRWWPYDEVAVAAWPPPPCFSGSWDVAIMVDVIEHMDAVTGSASVARALDVAPALVVATPHDPMRWPQDDHPNARERHVRRWAIDDVSFAASSAGGRVVEAYHLTESIVAVIER